MAEEEKKPEFKEGEFDEHTSYSFLFFLISAVTLFVTLWAFWDDEYARRGFKTYQNQYFKEQFAVAETQWKENNSQIKDKEKQINESLGNKINELAGDDIYLALADEVRL
ncbi:MAG: cytochrome C, partial [Nitrospinae bacterium]|nr:cytochrome C [Nitrospinota bacterium]